MTFRKELRWMTTLAFALSVGVVGCDDADSSDGGDASVTDGGTSGDATTTSDIVDTAVAAGNFTQLAAALQKANLVSALKGPGPFTVFAPTDAAFAAIKSTADSLTTDQLASVLKYHVVSGSVTADQVVKLTSATTLEGGTIAIKVEGGKVYLNGTTMVTTTDIKASNGVIHVIDKVLIPPSLSGGADAGGGG